MAFLRTLDFKIFRGRIPPNSPRKCTPKTRSYHNFATGNIPGGPPFLSLKNWRISHSFSHIVIQHPNRQFSSNKDGLKKWNKQQIVTLFKRSHLVLAFVFTKWKVISVKSFTGVNVQILYTTSDLCIQTQKERDKHPSIQTSVPQFCTPHT